MYDSVWQYPSLFRPLDVPSDTHPICVESFLQLPAPPTLGSFHGPVDVPSGTWSEALGPLFAMPVPEVLGSFDRPLGASIDDAGWRQPEPVQYPLEPEHIDEQWFFFISTASIVVTSNNIPWFVSMVLAHVAVPMNLGEWSSPLTLTAEVVGQPAMRRFGGVANAERIRGAESVRVF